MLPSHQIADGGLQISAANLTSNGALTSCAKDHPASRTANIKAMKTATKLGVGPGGAVQKRLVPA